MRETATNIVSVGEIVRRINPNIRSVRHGIEIDGSQKLLLKTASTINPHYNPLLINLMQKLPFLRLISDFMIAYHLKLGTNVHIAI